MVLYTFGVSGDHTDDCDLYLLGLSPSNNIDFGSKDVSLQYDVGHPVS